MQAFSLKVEYCLSWRWKPVIWKTIIFINMKQRLMLFLIGMACIKFALEGARCENRGDGSILWDGVIRSVCCSNTIDDGWLALFSTEYMPPATVVWITTAWSALPLSSSPINITESNSRKSLFLKILRNYSVLRIMCQSYSFSDSIKESRNLNVMWFIFGLFEINTITFLKKL